MFRRLSLWIACSALSALPGAPLAAQVAAPHSPQELLKALIENERQALLSKERYTYLSNERSDRTGGHLWTERVVETAQGRVRLLTAVDGQPLSPARAQQQRDRLAAIAANPADFIRREQAQHNDEEHARHMLEVLPRDFVFDNVSLQDGVWRMEFHPNPDVSPSGIEDQVLHGMSGWLAIDERQLRLLHIDGHLQQDVLIGFGLLADIHTGSRFSSDRKQVEGHWRTVNVATDIRGKAALFKSVSRNSELTRADFHYLDRDITVPEAVDLLLRGQEQLATR
jgi:hypothetical protein